ncbi:cysteine--tRNA ligase [candidate division TA06 bacterium]|uniref:Cysteine--tRNA ligase n=1 Tax=candidate division TA06 bacterium TaxID=2250710 RepID=A0A933MLC8_UNCT6|nr:cysteine--tRNA ligase [candidate division TA06 bacterium]
MPIHLYNTMTRKKEEFIPLEQNQAGIYACGPTVYNYAHIGNLRTYVFEDTLRRIFLYNGLAVNHVMNITDVDDKTIRASQKEGMSLKDFTEKYTKIFLDDCAALNIQQPDIMCKATGHIPEMIDLVQRLSDKGYAYQSGDGATYFNIAKFQGYGKLSGISLSGLKAGARVASDEYEKENLSDFALWKAWDQKDGDVFWESPFGKGRPGWHIECSAMSTKYLGETFDIHVGAVDLIFPHHENEIAQTEAATGKPWVRCWMHAEHLLVDVGKMSKSLNNFYRMIELKEKGYHPLAYRYFCFTGHYRSQLNFTWESLTAAQRALENLRAEVLKLGTSEGEKIGTLEGKDLTEWKNKFLSAINDDLNMPQALAVLWDTVKSPDLKPAQKLALIGDFDRVLGLNLLETKEGFGIPKEVEELLRKRQEARAAKNWAGSDAIRNQILALGYVVEDSKGGQTVREKKFGE